MEIQFTKLHENGNDFIVIDEWDHIVIPDDLKAGFAASYCDRQFGIGAGGVIFLEHPEKSGIRMRLLLPDESEADMYGNGIRCLAKYAFDAGYVKGTCIIDTLAGPVGVDMAYRGDTFVATISMPAPKFTRPNIPAPGGGEFKEHIGVFDVYAANTGVPHAVVLVDDLDTVNVEALAPPIRHHDSFTKGANVNFVQKTGNDSIRIRTFERGIEGETLSCGTGATASAAVVHHLGLTGETVKVETEGGPLVIYLKNGTKMEGPAETVFTGTIRF
ncbi:MAG: diaminopimelate epimerase [Methanoregula sp.]|nr:diaminopimelate epimerase [Methanoregula sp.]